MLRLAVRVAALLAALPVSVSALEPRPEPRARGDAVAAIDGLRDEGADDYVIADLARTCLKQWPRRGPVTLSHYHGLSLGWRVDQVACWLGGQGVETGRRATLHGVELGLRWRNPDGSFVLATFLLTAREPAGRLIATSLEGLPKTPRDAGELAQLASLEPARMREAARYATRQAEERAREAAAERARREREQQAEPCMVGEIKLDRETGLYYLPGDPPYGQFRDRERISCTATERGARSYGYSPIQDRERVERERREQEAEYRREQEDRRAREAARPCQVGQVKADADARVFYLPSHRLYAIFISGMDCFADETKAREAGYAPAEP